MAADEAWVSGYHILKLNFNFLKYLPYELDSTILNFMFSIPKCYVIEYKSIEMYQSKHNSFY
jgi:hypothetical protein